MNYMKKNKFFYAVPSIFPQWDYPSRLAIGVNLQDFRAKDAKEFRFMIGEKLYTISSEKAFRLGNKYKTPFFSNLPNLIPKEEFDEHVTKKASE